MNDMFSFFTIASLKNFSVSSLLLVITDEVTFVISCLFLTQKVLLLGQALANSSPLTGKATAAAPGPALPGSSCLSRSHSE
jgi:hypothetical protein